jgi:integrase
MACIRKRRGKYVVDYRDGAGNRRWTTCETRKEADAVLSKVIETGSQRVVPKFDLRIKVGEYSEHWLAQVENVLKPATVDSYAQVLRLYTLPVFGNRQVRSLHRGGLKSFLAGLLGTKLSAGSVRIVYATLRAMLNAAIDDGLITSNPAARLGKTLGLIKSSKQRQEEIKAMNRDQLTAFELAALETVSLTLSTMFLVMARTGIRIGEAIALEWDRVNLDSRTVRVEMTYSKGRLHSPKSGHGRDVDLSRQAVESLRKLRTEQLETWFRKGQKGEEPALVFPSATGTLFDTCNVEKAFKQVLKKAKLPAHFTPHCLRHTYASLLLQQGESVAYVQRQLGHASVQLTVDTYGRWLPTANKSAVDRLDDKVEENAAAVANGSKVVANGGMEEAGGHAKLLKSFGEPSRNRTWNLLIKSQLLCQLS